MSILGKVLSDPPVLCKNQAVKDRNAEAVLKVLTSAKEAQMKAAVDSLDADQVDTLMKYVYRHLSSGDNSAILLAWHAAAFEKGGLGSIVRAIASRRPV